MANVDATCKATIAEANARQTAIEDKIDAASDKLTAVEEQIRTAKADLDAAVTNRSSELASRTADAEHRFAELMRECEAAEDRLASRPRSRNCPSIPVRSAPGGRLDLQPILGRTGFSAACFRTLMDHRSTDAPLFALSRRCPDHARDRKEALAELIMAADSEQYRSLTNQILAA